MVFYNYYIYFMVSDVSIHLPALPRPPSFAAELRVAR